MTIRKPRELARDLARGARILGLDLGTRTVGLALSDVGRTLATPYDTIRRTKLAADLARLESIIAKEGVGALVLGLPVNMDGSEGPRCQATRQFATDLLKRIDLPLAFWDERLSTRAAEAALLEADTSRRRRAAVIDKVAAAVILQGFLDFAARNPPGEPG
jgi:putative Holliday junction resolvase